MQPARSLPVLSSRATSSPPPFISLRDRLTIGLFGLIITVMGLIAFGPEESARTGGLNANLWAGLVMIAVAIAFVVWARLDPIRMLIQENEPGAEEPRDISAID